jgi:hypothetical protein
VSSSENPTPSYSPRDYSASTSWGLEGYVAPAPDLRLLKVTADGASEGSQSKENGESKRDITRFIFVLRATVFIQGEANFKREGKYTAQAASARVYISMISLILLRRSKFTWWPWYYTGSIRQPSQTISLPSHLVITPTRTRAVVNTTCAESHNS